MVWGKYGVEGAAVQQKREVFGNENAVATVH